MGVSVRECEARINALEMEIRDARGSMEWLQSSIHEKENERVNCFGLFKKTRLKQIEKDIEETKGLIDAFREDIGEKEEELQQMKLLLEEIKVSTQQTSKDVVDVELTSDVIDRVNRAASVAVNGSYVEDTLTDDEALHAARTMMTANPIDTSGM